MCDYIGGIESLRAIPWTFAWTQTRLHLPAWLGIGEALTSHAGDSPDTQSSDEALRSMYNEWPFFREMIDLIAMTLSKTDYSISTNYELQLVDQQDPTLVNLGHDMRGKVRLVGDTKRLILVYSCDYSCISYICIYAHVYAVD
jgi:phosphoenolpyruvate carboxylase